MHAPAIAPEAPADFVDRPVFPERADVQLVDAGLDVPGGELHVLAGEGQIWRRDGTGEETTVLGRGVSIDIPVGTAFQYRCTGVDPLEFLCVTMPRWPGDKEATKATFPELWEQACRRALEAALGLVGAARRLRDELAVAAGSLDEASGGATREPCTWSRRNATLAHEQIEKAKKLIEDGDNEEAARVIDRAQADADLALALAQTLLPMKSKPDRS
mgnify:CR=1 FL=1